MVTVRAKLQDMMEDYPLLGQIIEGVMNVNDLTEVNKKDVAPMTWVPSCLAIRESEVDLEALDTDWGDDDDYVLIFIDEAGNVDKFLYHIGAERSYKLALRYGKLSIVSSVGAGRISRFL